MAEKKSKNQTQVEVILGNEESIKIQLLNDQNLELKKIRSLLERLLENK